VLLAALWASAAAALPDSPCRPLVSEDVRYTICTLDLRRHAVELVWRGPDGQPYGSLSALARAPAGRDLVAAMNAGMYHPDLAPVGLYVEGGRQITPANTANGPGNFHLKPNGIFYVSGGAAGILETRAYLRRDLVPDYATQSGPMLVIDGRIHPRFSDEGPSRKIRNGVGVRDARTVVLAISDEPVSFGAFARLFKDELGCRNALFLDGSISALHAPGLGRSDISFKPLGPILAVRPRSGRASP
jgi:uncharacterized protein YigE (DUF2233 family)